MQFDQVPEPDLIRQIQDGNDAAFDEILHRYKRPVLNFVYRLVGDATEAEDIAQEVFVRAYRHLSDYNPHRKFSTWLFALAHHAAIDHLRWRQRHPTDPIDAAPELAGGRPVESQILAREIGELIAAAVAALPEDQRAAIILSEYEGLSYAEIAEIMKCSEKSVESRLYRAKQTLRDRLKHLL